MPGEYSKRPLHCTMNGGGGVGDEEEDYANRREGGKVATSADDRRSELDCRKQEREKGNTATADGKLFLQTATVCRDT